VPIRVAGARRRDRDPWSDGIHERLGRRGPAAVVGHLQQVEPRQAVGEETRIDLLLDVAGQHEPPVTDRPKEHDGHVVDAGPAVGRFERDLAADRPQDGHADLVHGQPIAGRQAEPLRRIPRAQSGEPGRVAWSRSTCPRLEDPTHPVPVE